MDGRPHGIQMARRVGDLSTSKLSVGGRSSVFCLFCALRNLPDCARLEMLEPIFVVRWVVRGRPQAFVDCRNGSRVNSRVLLTISEDKSVLVR